jgi:hypothetical protein
VTVRTYPWRRMKNFTALYLHLIPKSSYELVIKLQDRESELFPNKFKLPRKQSLFLWCLILGGISVLRATWKLTCYCFIMQNSGIDKHENSQNLVLNG